MGAHDPYTLPPGLPVPEDDGAADHLPGMTIPHLELPTTDQRALDLAEAAQRLRPDVLDVSSGLEAAPGIKDAARLYDFFSAWRSLPERGRSFSTDR
jgi:hypothetical protein